MSGFSIWASHEGTCVVLSEMQAALPLVVPVSRIVLSAFAKENQLGCVAMRGRPVLRKR
jgi:hypothetical protein